MYNFKFPLNSIRIQQTWKDLAVGQQSSVKAHMAQFFLAFMTCFILVLSGNVEPSIPCYFFLLSLVHIIALGLVYFELPTIFSFLVSTGLGGALLIGLYFDNSSFQDLSIFFLFINLFWSAMALEKWKYEAIVLFLFLIQLATIYYLDGYVQISRATFHEDHLVHFILYSFLGIVIFFLLRQIRPDLNSTEEEYLKTTYAPKDLTQLLFMTLCGSIGVIEHTLDDSRSEGQLNLDTWQKMKVELQEVKRIQSDIATLANSDLNEVTFHPAPFYLNRLVEEISSEFEPEFKRNHIKLHFESHLTNDLVISDAYRIKQLVRTLLLNSIDHAAYGDVYFNCFSDPGPRGIEVYFHIQNTASVVPSNLEMLFSEGNENIELNGNRYTKFLLKSILGKLEAECFQLSQTSIGDSIEIRFELPVCMINEYEELTLHEKLGISISHIAYADDDPIMLLLMKNLFKTREEELSTFENGKLCVESFFAKNGEFDVVFVDCNMNEMDGYETTKAIRKFESFHKKKNIPIIAITSNSEKENIQKCYDCGMNFVIHKPFTKRDIFEILNQISSTPSHIS